MQVNPDTLLRLRVRRQLRQVDLADLARVSKFTISRIENGHPSAGRDPLVIERLARVLGVSVEVLCDERGMAA